MTRDQTHDPLAQELAELLDSGDADGAATDHVFREMLHLAQGLREVPTAVPTTEFRERLRGQLLTEAATMLPVAEPESPPATIGLRERFAHLRRSVSLAVASALSATAIGGAGVAVAAQSSLPGDTLYGVKRGIESVRLALASGDVETGRLHLALARERLEEVTDGTDELSPDRLIETLGKMDDVSVLGANELMDAYDRTGDTEVLRELAGFVDHQRLGLLAVMDDLPVEAVPFAERSLELVRRIEIQATELFLDGCVECPDGRPTIPRPGEEPALDTDAEPPVSVDEPGGTSGGDTTADTTEDASEDGLFGGGDDPIETPTVDPALPTVDPSPPTVDPSLPTVEPSLPTVDPSLPTDDFTEPLDDAVEDTTGSTLDNTAEDATEPLGDTVGDLLYE